jgi:hypothetical protein
MAEIKALEVRLDGSSATGRRRGEWAIVGQEPEAGEGRLQYRGEPTTPSDETIGIEILADQGGIITTKLAAIPSDSAAQTASTRRSGSRGTRRSAPRASSARAWLSAG